MSNLYSNLPPNKGSVESTVQAFDNYYTQPLELNAGVLDAMRGFFTSRGFEPVAAESIAVVIMKQAKKDGYNPMQILDTLKGLDSVEISALVSEILNYNRVKTSFLGYARQFIPSQEVLRNILA
jgi:hypothetical protein